MSEQIQKNLRILILTGDHDYSPSDYDHIITISPVRHSLLLSKGVQNSLFGDYSPGQERGVELDIELLRKLETCLEDEKQINEQLRWLPIIYQQLRHGLSYYTWLYKCMEQIVQSLHPSQITISSSEDEDFLFVLREISEVFTIDLKIEDNKECDHSTSIFHLVSVIDHPKRMDPLWFIRLHAFFLKLLHPKGEILYQEYWNINGYFDKKRHIKFNQHKALNYIGYMLVRISRIFIQEPIRTMVNNAFPHKHVENHLKSNTWECFTKCERLIINNTIGQFLHIYSPEFMDRLAKGAGLFFRILRPKRIILNADQISSARFLSQIAHDLDIKVDCLPHGLALENVSGPCLGSKYMPDRFLSWGKSSQETYKKLGWSAESVIHPRVNYTKQPYQKISKPMNQIKILFFTPEWGGLTLDGRKDCFEKTIVEVLTGLRKVGIPDQNLTIKYHPDQPGGNNIKLKTLLQLKNKLGMNFSIFAEKVDTYALIPKYDLIISGVTTGIFEAVLLGKPIILVGNQIPRIGAINKHNLPYAVTADEIARCLQEFDNERVADSCQQISESLQTGITLTSL